MKRNLIKIVNHYGINKQLKKFQNESFKIYESVIRHQEHQRNPIDAIANVLEPILAKAGNRKPTDRLEDIKNSIADITISLKEIQYYYGITDEEIISLMKENIKEQMKLIGKELKNCKNISQ